MEYKAHTLLSVPGKILESCISDTVLKHVTECELLTERQWAFRKGHSTQLLLAQLTESLRQDVDNNFVVIATFIDFRKAFDCVSHKLKIKFGIENLLSWQTLSESPDTGYGCELHTIGRAKCVLRHPTRISARPMFV